MQQTQNLASHVKLVEKDETISSWREDHMT